MFGNKDKFIRILAAAAAVFLLGGCGRQEAEPTAAPTLEPIVLPTAPVPETTEPSPLEDITELTVVMDPGDLYTLDHYPNLQRVDLSGSTCYWAIEDFIESHPHLEVIYTVDLGGTARDRSETELTLTGGSYSFEALLENLQYLPNLTQLSLPDTSLTGQQLTDLQNAYPELALSYTVELLGTEYDSQTTEIDLSAATAAQLEDVAHKLGVFTGPVRVRLSSGLTKAEVDTLQAAAPHILFDYSFSLFGKTVSTADGEIIFKNLSLDSGDLDPLREALSILDHCGRFVLDNCGLDNETMAQLREEFRGGPKVIWRVWFGTGNRYTTLTDDDTIRAVYNVTDDTCGPMKYLEDVKYMDIGHNETLSDLSFVGYMPKLEVLIASGCNVSELVGFDNCKNLTWLELAYCYKLTNIDSLAGCTGLKYLNLSYSKVTSLEMLDTLPLERFVYLRPQVSADEQNAFIATHPKGDCITVFYGYSMPYSYGWRYDDNGKTMFWYYKDVIRKVFNYDQADAILNAQNKDQ